MTKYTPLQPLISATVLADSISNEGIRLSTVEMVYPRFIHSEFMTHRVFSKNAASSRAIPWKRMKAMILANPAVPASWRMNEGGMQGFTVADLDTTKAAEDIWLRAMASALEHAEEMEALKMHKQHVNRLVEPYVHMRTVVTGVYWDNFGGLRDHHMADPTIDALAKVVKTSRAVSKPRTIQPGEWHLPYVTDEDFATLGIEDARKVSAARCARTSYNNMTGKLSSLDEDIALHDRLLVDQPIHASPAEHQATPDYLVDEPTGYGRYWANEHLHGNLHGWCQYRKSLIGENMDTLVK